MWGIRITPRPCTRAIAKAEAKRCVDTLCPRAAALRTPARRYPHRPCLFHSCRTRDAARPRTGAQRRRHRSRHHARRREAYGLELGVLGTLTLRTVLPWRDESDELIGFIEMSEDISQLIGDICPRPRRHRNPRRLLPVVGTRRRAVAKAEADRHRGVWCRDSRRRPTAVRDRDAARRRRSGRPTLGRSRRGSSAEDRRTDG